MYTINQILDIEPDNCFYLQYKGRLYYRIGDTLNSVTSLDNAVKKCPKNYDCYLERAIILQYFNGNFDEIIKSDFEYAMSLSSNNFQVVKLTANYYFKTKNYSRAKELYKSILDNQEEANIFVHYGLCEKNLGNLNEAIHYINSAISLDSTNFYAYESLANTYFDNTLYSKSLTHYLDALTLLEQTHFNENLEFKSSLLNRIAFNYYKLYNLEESLNFNSKALELNTNEAEIYKDRALIFLKLNKINDAKINYYKSKELGYKNYVNDDFQILVNEFGK